MRNYYIFITILTILVIATVIVGFVVGGTPVSLQAISLDTTRLNDFRSLTQSIQTYHKNNGRLPPTLSDLSLSHNISDPVTQKNYGYEIVSTTSYKLCTEFATDTTKEEDEFYTGTESQKHQKGYDCIVYNLPEHILRAPSKPPIANVLKITGTYQRIEQTSQGSKMIIQEGSSGEKGIYFEKARVVNSKDALVTPSVYFEVGDPLIVEVSIIRGQDYEASKIQNLSR